VPRFFWPFIAKRSFIVRALIRLTVIVLGVAGLIDRASAIDTAKTIRVATYNVSLYRPVEGALRRDLQEDRHEQIRGVTAVLQKIRPDIVLLNEFDYDPASPALFLDHYLRRSQLGLAPLDYAHHFIAPSNTGVPSGVDLDRNGRIEGGNDALGFGLFPGQYGMLVLSRFPIDTKASRTFKDFLWRDMPNNLIPTDWYSADAIAVLPLSSKSHWDIAIDLPRADGESSQRLHLLASHPTPPGFDGPEDRNGRRNHDEIRLWADYISDQPRSNYLIDDQGRRGGLAALASFVIVGDLNADPLDGGSVEGTIARLLGHPRVHREVAGGSLIPRSQGGTAAAERQGGPNLTHRGDPAFDTGDFDDRAGSVGNLRVDYVLPSADMTVCASGVVWPTEETGPAMSSDHRLVWVDVAMPGQGCPSVSSKP
jgi:endonuclease/exonuclease/phosphatase family metal-dependent hydrolase